MVAEDSVVVAGDSLVVTGSSPLPEDVAVGLVVGGGGHSLLSFWLLNGSDIM